MAGAVLLLASAILLNGVAPAAGAIPPAALATASAAPATMPPLAGTIEPPTATTMATLNFAPASSTALTATERSATAAQEGVAQQGVKDACVAVRSTKCSNPFLPTNTVINTTRTTSLLEPCTSGYEWTLYPPHVYNAGRKFEPMHLVWLSQPATAQLKDGLRLFANKMLEAKLPQADTIVSNCALNVKNAACANAAPGTHTIAKVKESATITFLAAFDQNSDWEITSLRSKTWEERKKASTVLLNGLAMVEMQEAGTELANETLGMHTKETHVGIVALIAAMDDTDFARLKSGLDDTDFANDANAAVESELKKAADVDTWINVLEFKTGEPLNVRLEECVKQLHVQTNACFVWKGANANTMTNSSVEIGKKNNDPVS
jgi:hypothetical protein